VLSGVSAPEPHAAISNAPNTTAPSHTKFFCFLSTLVLLLNGDRSLTAFDAFVMVFVSKFRADSHCVIARTDGRFPKYGKTM
jgi:hypothetical protein